MKILLPSLIALLLSALMSNTVNTPVKNIPTTVSITPVYVGYVDTLVVLADRIKTPVVKKSTKKGIDHYLLESYPYDSLYPELKYDLPVTNWEEKYVILFTNVVSRESGALSNEPGYEIDKYLVAISCIRRFYDSKKGIVQYSYYKKYNKKGKINSFWKKQAVDSTETHYKVPLFVGTAGMEPYTKPNFTHPWDKKAWDKCHSVVTDVLNNTIPDHIPYVPKGTHFWMREELCTDSWWVNRLKDTTLFTKVAHTVVGHQYYSLREYHDNTSR
jgi:hypothetical protein